MSERRVLINDRNPRSAESLRRAVLLVKSDSESDSTCVVPQKNKGRETDDPLT
jgi:hypothetical protein